MIGCSARCTAVHPICRNPCWPSVMVLAASNFTLAQENRPRVYHLAPSASSFMGPCPCWVWCWRGFVDHDKHQCGWVLHVIRSGLETVPSSEVPWPSTSKMWTSRKEGLAFVLWKSFSHMKYNCGNVHPPKMVWRSSFILHSSACNMLCVIALWHLRNFTTF